MYAGHKKTLEGRMRPEARGLKTPDVANTIQVILFD
jgi:hypothetical protein